MALTRHLPVALSSGIAEDDEVRTFLQARLAQWCSWGSMLAGGFYVFNLIVWMAVGGVYRSARTWPEVLLLAATLFHLAGAAIMGLTAMIARGRPLSRPALRALEVFAFVGSCTCFAFMGRFIGSLLVDLGNDPQLGLFAGLLASLNNVTARAIMVPSTPRRTALLSVVALTPVPIVTAFNFPVAGEPERVISLIAWCALAIVIATLGSRVIFGLRKEAAQVKRLGQYTLIEKIGAGGMGVVYRASHAMLRRPTAIKLLQPDRTGDARLTRFEREVQMTSELTHPNTVAIYDYGRTPDGLFYYAMEFLDGINLEQLVAEYGPQPAGRVVRILEQVSGALAEAHERGLIHRDVKPANVILTERGEPDVVKLVDFGLVKRIEMDTADVTMTTNNVITGTPVYMSPEAITAPDRVDARTDIYAVGAVGYFLLTGRAVFEGPNAVAVFAQHLHTEPVAPSVRLNAAVPAELEAIVMRCLRKAPEERPQTARTLLRDLRTITGVDAWTVDDAARWWQLFRSERRIGPGGAVKPEEGATVNVDLAARIAASS